MQPIHSLLKVLVCLTWVTAESILSNEISQLNIMDWKQYSPSELEKQVSPSRWNPTKNPDDVINDYIKLSSAETELARKSIPCNLNVSYGTLPSQKFDVYGTDLAEDSPIFFWIHGGYWQEGTKDIAGGFAPQNYKSGYKTVSLGYTLAPAGKINEMEQELILALQHLIKLYPRGNLVVGGHSAGGQLSAALLHLKSLPIEIANRLSGLVLVSGVFDLRPLVSTYVNTPLKMDEKEAESLSGLLLPFNNVVHFNDMKILVLVGGLDSPEFQRQSAAYYDKLKEGCCQQVNFYKSEKDDHFTIVQNLSEESSSSNVALQDFLKSFPSKGETRSSGGSVSFVNILPVTLLSLFVPLM